MLTKYEICLVTVLLLKCSIDTPNEAKMKLFCRILSRKIAFENVVKMISDFKKISRFTSKVSEENNF